MTLRLVQFSKSSFKTPGQRVFFVESDDFYAKSDDFAFSKSSAKSPGQRVFLGRMMTLMTSFL